MTVRPIPLTVIGGYLGSGKTTLVNHLLRHPGGRRIGVIVNDFGSLAIDADLLAEQFDDDVISLANGCICCTVGAGLHDALATLTARIPAPDHVVVEVSGVADPVSAAGWGRVPPFAPGGVLVLAAADTVLSQAADKYVGGEVLRQLEGADLLLVTKADRCTPDELQRVEAWLDRASDEAPRVQVVNGEIATDLVLGLCPDEVAARRPREAHGAQEQHTDRYSTWSWTSTRRISREALDRFLADLPPGVLRLKGTVNLFDASTVLVQVVGRHAEVTPHGDVLDPESRLVAIGLADVLEGPALDRIAPT